MIEGLVLLAAIFSLPILWIFKSLRSGWSGPAKATGVGVGFLALIAILIFIV